MDYVRDNFYYIYLLQSFTTNKWYTGYTNDLKSRLNSHREGSIESTKNFRPVKLVFYSAFSSKRKALMFEKYLKSSSGFAFRNIHLV